MRRAFAYISPHWRSLAVVLLISLLSTALTLYLPYLSKVLVDDALIGRSVPALVRIVLTFAGITLLSFGLNIASGLRYTKVSADILFAMRLDLYGHLQRLSPRFYAHMPLGQIVSRINNDIGEIQRVVGDLALAWIGNVLFLIGTTVMLIYLDVRLFLVSLIMMPPALWALVRYRSRLEAAIGEMRARSADIGTFLIDTLQGMRLVVGANAQDREAARFRQKNDAFVDAVMAMRRLTYYSGGLPGLLLSGGSAAVFLYGGWRVIDNTLSLGTLVAFIAYQMRLLAPVQALMDLYASIATVRVSLRRVHEILDVRVDVVEPAQPAALMAVRGELRFRNVQLTFGRGAPVLDGVDIDIAAGEVVAIVGASGAGKSTIADLLIRQLDPDAGSIALDGHDLRTLRLEDLRRHVVVVDQEPFLLHASVAENIRYARPAASDAEVTAAARAAGLRELIARMPQGVNTTVGERGRALSAGERQRLSMARALLADPAVLVLDEATGALDPATEAEVVAGYEAVMRGRTTVIITHRLELARLAERVIVLENGRVCESGTADELMVRGGNFARLFASLQRA
ncbi:MAG TPA: ABC transporter ATP-binding protein [Longimicrobiales bacterium]|nr:ABC transporter ATP-binding protein [Longimicrobiales bacterium]